jgi:tryptophan-rich sensory protein
MKPKYKLLVICIAIPLFAGALSAFITRNSMTTFQLLNKPPLTPPGILFPIVWTILYTLMGIASYFVLTSRGNVNDISTALTAYGLQLFLNILWPIFFFGFDLYLFSFFVIVVLWLFIVRTIRLFYNISKISAYLLIPYLIWVTFAAYLNLGFVVLN